MNFYVENKSKIVLLLFTMSLFLTQPIYSMKRKSPDGETKNFDYETQDCKPQSVSPPFCKLPTEILAQIASYLPWEDINNTALTCKDFYNRFVDPKRTILLQGTKDQIKEDIQVIEDQKRLESNEFEILVSTKYPYYLHSSNKDNDFITFLNKRAKRICRLDRCFNQFGTFPLEMVPILRALIPIQ